MGLRIRAEFLGPVTTEDLRYRLNNELGVKIIFCKSKKGKVVPVVN